MEKTTSTVVKTVEPQVQPRELPKGNDPPIHSITTVGVPYTSYQMEKGHPYTADYFKLGDTWDVFRDELMTIETFMQDKVNKGEIADSQKAIEKEISIIEKMNNIKDEERAVVRIGILSAYIKFLNDTKDIKKYAN